MPSIAEKISAVAGETNSLRAAIRDTNARNSKLHLQMSHLQAELDQCAHAIDAEIQKASKLDNEVVELSSARNGEDHSLPGVGAATSSTLSDSLRQAITLAGNQLEHAHQVWIDVSAKRARTEQALNKQLAANEAQQARVKSREKTIAASLKEATHVARVVRDRESELSGLRQEISTITTELSAVEKRSRTFADRLRSADAESKQQFAKRSQQKELAVGEVEAAEKRQQQIDILRRENRTLIQKLLARNFAIGSVSIGDPLLSPGKGNYTSSKASLPVERAPKGDGDEQQRQQEGDEEEVRSRRMTEEALLETMERLIRSVSTRASAGRAKQSDGQ